MKKTFVKIISKKLLSTAVLPGAVNMTASGAKANNHIEIISSNIQSSVQCMGADENTFLFTVNISNPDAETITMEVRNDSSEILFAKKFTEQNILQHISLKNDDLIAHYHFIIKTKNKESDQSYFVTITTKTTEDVAV